MATTLRGVGSTSVGRQRRGISPSPSPSPSPSQKKFPKHTLTTRSTSCSPTNPTTDRKQPPSQLRPNRSSKTLSEPPFQKLAPTRRHSLDRPPPGTTLVQKGSPGGPNPRPLRSSSMTLKSTPWTRVAPERQSTVGKTLGREKKVEPKLSKSRSLNTGTVGPKAMSRSPSVVGLKKKCAKSLTSESSNDSDIHLVEHLFSDDDLVYTHHGDQSLSEITEMPLSIEDLRDPINQDVTEEPTPEEINTQKKEEPSVDDDQNHDHGAQVQSGEEEQGDQKGESAGDNDGVHQKELGPIRTFSQKMEEMELALPLAMEKEEKGEVEKESSPNSAPAVVCADVKVKTEGFKENQDYNEVIEQAASRLMGKKNKVLALAGAFETVISYANKN